ncbi:PLP-dependent aminotransferase family protein [bacterium]|nr:PLP-dependent aminotransferase family protein [bacterium]
MPAYINDLYSEKISKMKKSIIRELLKLTQKPDVISFAGGLPSPATFPVEEIAEMAREVILKEGDWALQYGATEGITQFRDEIVKILKADDLTVERDNILVTTASQQGLDMVGRVFINSNDPIIIGRPTYVGAISAFRGYDARFIGVSLDDHGMKTDELRSILEDLAAGNERPKFIYTVPDFQNPAGVTLSLERRKDLLKLAKEFKTIIIEDSPYRQLRYTGEHVPQIYKLDGGEGNVIMLQTFSKILFPGLRLGWITAHKDIIDKFVIAKQAMDLCTPPISQSIAYEYCRRGELGPHIKENVALYGKKRKKMLDALDTYMPDDPGIHWTKPEGGLFLWLTLPDYFDVDAMFMEAIEENVAYVTGTAFYADGGGKNAMRLNFSYPTEEQIDQGIQRLAKVIKKNLK